MSGVDGLWLDADGFVDMDQYPDDGSDVTGSDLDGLRAALHSDPVDEPTQEQWDAMFDSVMDGVDEGPFAVDGVDTATDDLGDVSTDGVEDALVAEDDLADDVDPDDGDLDDGGLDPVDDGIDVDHGVDDDGGLDLTPDAVPDDPFAVDDDVPTDIADNDFEDLL